MKKIIMAIGGHVGDAELTAGGVLASMALEGHKIITVALTGGEKGNPPEIDVDKYRIQKEHEAKEFAKMLNGEAIVLPYKDGELPDNDEVRFMVCDLIRKYKPNVLITHWKNSMHKDHSLTHKIVKDAQFYAGIRGFVRKDDPHYAAGPFYAENWEDPEGFHPYYYVKVSEEGFKLWQKAIETHWFTTGSKSFKYKQYYEALMSVRGKEARTTYAIAFDVDYTSKKVIKDSF